MSFLPVKKIDYSDGRTKQSFKDSTDINQILTKMQKAGTLSHLEQYGGEYGDFSGYDFHTNMIMLAKGRELFEALPAEIRKEFEQDVGEFFDYVNDPANKERLPELLPGLAEPGRQRQVLNPAVDPAPDEAPVPPAEPVAVEETPAAEPPVEGA